MAEAVSGEIIFGAVEANSRYSLCNLIEGRYQELMEENNEPVLLDISPYYENDSFVHLANSNQDKFIILSLNCQSLNAKFNELRLYVELYAENLCSPTVICLQETWLHENSDISLLQLPGYQLVWRPRSCSAHGSVAFYFLDYLSYTVVNVFENTTSWDGLFIEVELGSERPGFPKENLIVGNIYRPPNSNIYSITSFTDDIQQIFRDLDRKTRVIIAGDF